MFKKLTHRKVYNRHANGAIVCVCGHPENEHTSFICHHFNRRGLIEPSQDGRYRLKSYGRRLIRSYVERTGDGPEDLKAMFRFGS